MKTRLKLTINPNQIRTRDLVLVALINGATKGGPHVDHKKAAARRACRRPVELEERS